MEEEEERKKRRRELKMGRGIEEDIGKEREEEIRRREKYNI
jgi:hypothetical protein